VGVAVLSAIGSEENVGTIIGIHVALLALGGAKVGTAVADHQVLRKQRDRPGMVFEAIEIRDIVPMLVRLGLAAFSGQIDEFEGVCALGQEEITNQQEPRQQGQYGEQQ